MSDDLLADVVKRIVKLLVAGDVSAIERMTNGVRLSASEIRTALRDFGPDGLLPG